MTYQKNTAEKAVAGLESMAERIAKAFAFLKGSPLGWLYRTVGKLAGWYRRRVWQRFARKADGNLGKRRVSAILFSTAFAFWMIPAMIGAVWQGTLMLTTWENETIFLTNSEEVGDDVFAIKGCRKIPCSEADATYFRVRSTLAHTIYAFGTRGNAFYPDYTASVVAPGVNSCEVTSYGIRVKALMRGWDVYPDMLDAVCVPYQTNDTFVPADSEK